MADYVLIDGKNLAYRVGWVHKNLQWHGKPTGTIFGFLNSLVKIKQQYPKRYIAIAWDGIPKARIEASQKGVEQGIIHSSYKANREEKIPNPEMEKAKSQIPELIKMLNMVGVHQGFRENEEADDIIATWTAKGIKRGRKVTIISGDRDFYQLLWDGVEVYDAMKKKTMTKTTLLSDYGLDPEQWIDVGAIGGDTGDNIIGCPGWGEKTAIKYLLQHYTWQKVYEFIKTKTKRGKKEEEPLKHYDRMTLAYQLKKMDTDLKGCPKMVPITWNREGLRVYFAANGFRSLRDQVGWLGVKPGFGA